MRIFTSTFYSALIIFGMTTAEVVIGHLEQGRFKAEEIYCVKRYKVGHASGCLNILKELKNVDWRLA
jgi:hypothetical protein